jgi:Tol biopolymer transport system component/predicted Ser/Thr protein kinase
MPLTTGTRLGPYEILSAIGAGGMGEVYKAKDTRLDRLVAVKVLPAALASDPEFRERFEREAKSISALNHPNICTLYDVGDGFLVMEYLEGETLAARIQKGPLQPTEALSIATEIASALDRAHRQGIVHRDLKPGNVMLTKAGSKLLDFGLAKIGQAGAVSGAISSAMRTVTAPPGAGQAPLTAQGTILGTFQYMAPEQIEGEEADSRTDIFSFGAVLFEMLTGRKAFTGKSQASLVGAILKDDPPPVSQLQPLTPPALDRVVKTCLAKDRDDRFQTAHDLLLQLRWIAEGGSAAGLPAPVVAHRRNRERAAWIAFAVAALLWTATLVPAWWYFHTPPDDRQIQFSVATPDTPTTAGAYSPAISPDGRLLAFVAPPSPGAGNVLWVRPIGDLQARPLAGTEGAGSPFWSPDSRYLLYAGGGKLMKVDVAGAPPQKLCDVVNFLGASWNRDNAIVFAIGGGLAAQSVGGALYQVPASGGAPTEIARPDRTAQHTAYMWPAFLPDGRHFLYLAWSNEPGKRAVYAGSLDGGSPTLLVEAESMALYAAPGFLLYQREGSLLAQAFDPAHLRLSGEPVRVGDNVIFSRTNGRSAFTVSDTGVLAFRVGVAGAAIADLAWVSRAGKPLGTAGDAGEYTQVRLSPDEKRAVVMRTESTGSKIDLWTTDLSSNITSQLTFENTSTSDPVWSPDARAVAFESIAKGRRDFYQQVVGARESTLAFESPDDPKWLDDWSADGKFLLFHLNVPSKLYAVPLSGDRKPLLLAQTQRMFDSAHFSPDSKWVSYNADESGQYEVWVASFPAFDNRRQVSAHGGGQARWRADGKELFFLTPDGQMMSVAIASDVKSGTLEFKAPTPLFVSPIARPSMTVDQYDVARDGQRFLFVRPRREQNAFLPPITVVVNWQAGLKK